MENIKLTKEMKKKLVREIARLSMLQYNEECMGCIKNLAFMINLIAAVLVKKLTANEFLDKIAEGDGGPKMLQFYLDLFEV